MILSANVDFAHHTPNGTPMMRAMTIDTNINDRVTMVRSQYPRTPTPTMAKAPAIAARTPPVNQPTTAVSATTPGHRSPCNMPNVRATHQLRTSAMGESTSVNNQFDRRFRVIHL